MPWLWRFPLDYYLGIALSLVLAGLSAWAAGGVEPLRRHLWMLAGLAILVALTVLAAPLYHRWYRHMRRPGHDDRGAVRHLSAAGARGGVGRRRDPILHARQRRETDMRTWPLALGAAAGAAGWGIYNAISPKGQGFGKSFVGTPGQGKLMALTFDDGPNTAWTPQLLEVLDKHGVKATFFSIGHYAREQPSLLREVAAAGHAIGNHTYTHVTMPLHTDETIRRELRDTTRAIEEAGVEMARVNGRRLMRPPYGRRRPGTLRVLWEEGYVPILWSVTLWDWRRA